jgi:hypothetical protein
VLVLVLALVAGANPSGYGAGTAAASEPVLETTLPLNQAVAGTDISKLGGNNPQYRNNNQRNFWWNATARRWDGLLPTASPPAASASQWWFWHDLGGASPQPMRFSEDAPARTPDAYWDQASQMLFVFYSRGDSGTSKFRRYRYDQPTDRYIEVSRSGGINAPTQLRGGPRVTILRSPNGYLWAAVNATVDGVSRIVVSRFHRQR